MPDDNLTAALDGIRERWAQVDYVVLKPEVLLEPGPAPYRLPDVTRLLTAVDEVLKLHQPQAHFWIPGHHACSADGFDWPCSTALAIARALDVESA